MHDARPGSNITLEILRAPTSAAGRKTLVRLCRKDPRLVSHHRRQSRTRPSHQDWTRGGNLWNHRMKTRTPVALRPGEKYSILASVDVLRDLASIAKFVKVSPAV